MHILAVIQKRRHCLSVLISRKDAYSLNQETVDLRFFDDKLLVLLMREMHHDMKTISHFD